MRPTSTVCPTVEDAWSLQKHGQLYPVVMKGKSVIKSITMDDHLHTGVWIGNSSQYGLC